MPHPLSRLARLSKGKWALCKQGEQVAVWSQKPKLSYLAHITPCPLCRAQGLWVRATGRHTQNLEPGSPPPRQSPNLGALAPVGLGGASSSGGQCRGHPGIYPVSLLPFGSHSHRSGSEKAGGMPEWARPFPPLPREATGSPGKTCLSQAKKPRQRSWRSAKQAGPTCALGPFE